MFGNIRPKVLGFVLSMQFCSDTSAASRRGFYSSGIRLCFTWMPRAWLHLPRSGRRQAFRQLDDGLDASFRLLCKLRKRIKGEEYELPDYDGEDATRILMLADHADLFNHPVEHGVAISYVTEYGFWLRTPEGDRFLAFANFPRVRDAPVRHILHVEEVTPGHYHWPDLDVDLSLQIIRNPERFPLVSKQT